jgi:imidazolonepropionase-like amidohydrolase
VTERIEARQLVPGRGEPVADGVVVIEDDRITYAGTAADAPDTPRATTTTCDTVMPGMWDAHAHLIGMHDLRLADWFQGPTSTLAIRAASDASRALRMGFTSLREVGGPGVHVERVRREGLVRTPRVFSSNGIISTTGGHADIHELSLDTVGALNDSGLMALADGVPEVLRAVRRQLRENAKVIKVCASGGVLSEVDDPIHQQFSHEELRAIVEEAGRAERVVAAHCHGAPGIEAAVEAGVHTIEHGSFLTEDLASAMVERDMVLVPTRTIVGVLVEQFGSGRAMGASPEMVRKGLSIAERHLEAMHIAVEAGVTIAAGTDLGLSPVEHPLAFGRNAKELEHLVEVGMTPLQAIEAATATGPLTLGPQARRTGVLAADHDADVLALSADPVADITVLQDPASIAGVWLGGERVVSGRDGVPELTPLPLPG